MKLFSVAYLVLVQFIEFWAGSGRSYYVNEEKNYSDLKIRIYFYLLTCFFFHLVPILVLPSSTKKWRSD